MDVLHIITTISRGGAENHLVDLIRHQVDAGFIVGVAWLKGTDYWKRNLANMGVRLFDLQIDNYWDFRAVLRLRRVIWREYPAIVHSHLPPAELCARVALIGIDRVFIVTKHNDAPFCRGFGRNQIGRWVARRAQRLICISEAVAGSVARHNLEVSAEKLRCIRYGVNADLYLDNRDSTARELRRVWGCTPDTVVFGCVARMVPQKDHATLLRAFSLLNRLNGDAKLVLVGDGPLRENIQSLAAILGVVDSMVIAGFHEDIPAVMNAIDVLCLTSLYEGFGLVLIEAMASAKPVLATRVSSIPEIVVDNVTGVLVEKQDVQGLHQGMQDLLSRKRREEFGRAGRARVITEFSLQAMFRKTDEVYAELGVVPLAEETSRGGAL